jgi:hypothetical protein
MSLSNIEFRVRVSDLRSATKQLLVNRGEFADSDFADLLVSEVIATIRAVATTTEIPVAGLSLGAARIPLAVMDRVVRAAATFKRKEVRVLVSEGTVKVDTMVHTHPGIIVGIIPNQTIDLPINASILETLGIASILSEAVISAQGLTKRVQLASETAERLIKIAAGTLSTIGISEQEIRVLAKDHIQQAGQQLAKTFANHKF